MLVSCQILQNLHHRSNLQLTKIHLSRSATKIHYYKEVQFKIVKTYFLPDRQIRVLSNWKFWDGGDIYWQIDKPWWVDQYSNFIIQLFAYFSVSLLEDFLQADCQYITLFIWGGKIKLKFLGCFFKVNIDWRWSDSTAAATEPFPPPSTSNKYSIQKHLKLQSYPDPLLLVRSSLSS